MRKLSSSIRDDLVAEWEHCIRTGKWAMGQVLPTEHELSVGWQASRGTIRSALRIIEERGWVESRQGTGRWVRAIPGRRDITVGLLSRGSDPFGQNDLDGGHGLTVMVSAHERMSELGANLFTLTFNNEQGRARSASALDTVDFSMLDGVLVLAPQYGLATLAEIEARIPTVVLNRNATGVGIPSVLLDIAAHSNHATRYLLERGHRKILYFYSKIYHGTAMQQGFNLAVRQMGVSARGSTYQAWVNHANREQVANDILGRLNGETAIVTYGYGNLLMLDELLRRNGGSLRDKLEGVCLTAPGPDAPEGVHGFNCPIAEMTYEAINLLYRRITEKSDVPLYNPFYGAWTGPGDFGVAGSSAEFRALDKLAPTS